jgi:DNA polymerase-1
VAILSYLLDPGRVSHAVDSLAMEVLRRKTLPLAGLTGRGRGQLERAAVPVERMAAHAAEQADLALQLADRLRPQLAAHGLESLYREVELPLVEVLADMEMTGVKVDVPFLRSMSAELDRRLAELTARIHALAGVEFNINSPRQLGEVLFDKMQLPVLKKTRKSRAASTDTEVLEELAAAYELPRLVLEHRELGKLKGTYVDALPALVDPRTGRLHTSYNQTVAATGRLSSSEPNLQNIPIRTDLGRQIRRAFRAEDGAVLLVADYSQVELRLMAHLSGDPELVAAFRDGADVHRRTAASVFGLPEELVTPELRRRAKVINFGIIYGMSPYGLSRELGVPPGEAAKLIEQYFARYAGVRAWLDRTIEETRRTGRSQTLLGRIRYIPEITSDRRPAREYAERTAVNTPIQGSAADLIKLAMVRIARRLEGEGLGGRLTLQVHDELVLEVPQGEAEATAALVRSEMEGAASLSVPLVVAVGRGRNWLEAK